MITYLNRNAFQLRVRFRMFSAEMFSEIVEIIVFYSLLANQTRGQLEFLRETFEIGPHWGTLSGTYIQTYFFFKLFVFLFFDTIQKTLLSPLKKDIYKGHK